MASSNQDATESVLTVYIDENTSENDAREFANQIRAIPYVDSASFISRQQALNEFMSLAEDTYINDGIDESNFRDRYLVYITDATFVEQVISDLLGIQGVVKVSIGFRIDDSEIFAQRQEVYEQNTAESNIYHS